MRKWLTRHAPWILLGAVSAVSLYFWLLSLSDDALSAYDLFPIFGILAWEIMWVQCVIGAATIAGFRRSKSRHFKPFSERAVLLLIMLHPAVFLLQRFLDVGQLPPLSYLSYVGQNSVWAINLGIAGLVVFLSYGVFKAFRTTLQRHKLYRYVSVLQASAMIAIFFHGLALGGLMATGFVYVWIALGVVLVPCLALYVAEAFTPRRR